jgi:hypothetical protein
MTTVSFPPTSSGAFVVGERLGASIRAVFASRVLASWRRSIFRSASCHRIEGDLQCEGTKLSNKDGDALSAARAEIGGSVSLTGPSASPRRPRTADRYAAPS